MNYKVVIIDDEPWTRQVIKKLGNWEENNIRIVGEASDGLSGLDLITQLRPDIILTDVKMPILNGLELIRELKKQNLHTKTIVISGHDDFRYIREALKLQVTDYLLKPIKPKELNEQLSRCVKQLKDEWNTKSESLYDACAFMSVDWLDKYNIFKEEIFNSLLARDEHFIKTKLSDLENIIVDNESDDISIKLLICIYYDLMHSLERYVTQSGYRIEQVFKQENLSLVFRQDMTLRKVMMFITNLHLKAVENIDKLNNAHNKADIAKIKEYVDANYKGSISLEEVANRFYISKEYLSKLYKEYTGESFSSYVTKKRMQKAKTLIAEYNIPIKEVCEIVGYSDKAHFYKMFKKHFNLTPGQLKNKI